MRFASSRRRQNVPRFDMAATRGGDKGTRIPGDERRDKTPRDAAAASGEADHLEGDGVARGDDGGHVGDSDRALPSFEPIQSIVSIEQQSLDNGGLGRDNLPWGASRQRLDMDICFELHPMNEPRKCSCRVS